MKFMVLVAKKGEERALALPLGSNTLRKSDKPVAIQLD
jgi:hypothetical protein